MERWEACERHVGGTWKVRRILTQPRPQVNPRLGGVVCETSFADTGDATEARPRRASSVTWATHVSVSRGAARVAAAPDDDGRWATPVEEAADGEAEAEADEEGARGAPSATPTGAAHDALTLQTVRSKLGKGLRSAADLGKTVSAGVCALASAVAPPHSLWLPTPGAGMIRAPLTCSGASQVMLGEQERQRAATVGGQRLFGQNEPVGAADPASASCLPHAGLVPASCAVYLGSCHGICPLVSALD